MTTRHTWDKLDTHRYRCRRCGLLKTHVPVEVGRHTPDWTIQFTAPDGTVSTGTTPPCHGKSSVQPSRTRSQWNAYVEAGASLAERRARLAEVPDEWRESVRAHVALVFQLREAARWREQARAAKARALGLRS